MPDQQHNPLQLEGNKVILEEISPKYFSLVVEWRNNPVLNRYLNQPFVLTETMEREWYENVYLKDEAQGFMIMIDRKNGTAFGTCGWTNMDLKEKCCICGRVLRGDNSYKGNFAFYEAFFLLADYLYQFVDVMYAHVVKENIASLAFHEKMGFLRQVYEFHYPHEQFVKGMEQVEFRRDKHQYSQFRKNIRKESVGHIPPKYLLPAEYRSHGYVSQSK